MDTRRQVWFVCYDVCASGRLRRVYRILRGYGDHVQYSVFRCELSPAQRASLVGELEQVIKPTEDQVLFIPLGRPDGARDRAIQTLGVPLTFIERVCHVV